jgi:hypothetical protein
LTRQRWFEKYKEARERLDASQREIAALQVRGERLEEEIVKLCERIAELEREIAQPKLVEWPVGEVPPGQQFGASMITLCVNLAREIGLRPVERVLRIVSEWMMVKVRIPTYQAIRGWMQRIGLDRMKNAKKTSNGIWLVDHTNQIGKEKVLTVLRVRSSGLPRPGVPLRHRDVEVLTLTPGRNGNARTWPKCIENGSSFRAPRAGDGCAVELARARRNPGETGTNPIVIRTGSTFWRTD